MNGASRGLDGKAIPSVRRTVSANPAFYFAQAESTRVEHLAGPLRRLLAAMWCVMQTGECYGSKERAKSRLIKAAIAPMAMIVGIAMATSAIRHKCSMGISQRLNSAESFPRVRSKR